VSPAGVATALYGWMERYRRDGVDWDWRSLYGACAAAGVDAVETDATPEKLRILHDLGLAVSGSYVGLPLHPAGAADALEAAVLPVAERLAEAGGRVLTLNADPVPGAPGGKTADDVRRQGEHLTRAAELVRPLGLRVALHNHADRFDDAAADLVSVVEHASSEVGLCIDAHWAAVAGHDPVAWAREHPDRVLSLHLRNGHGRVPTEDLDDGDVDVPGLLAALPDYRGWLTLELWHPDSMTPERSMEEDTRRSAGYLRRLLA
jgi:sugar phosphate isomerase/epimerase